MNSLVVSGAVLLGLLLLVIVWRRGERGKAEPYDLQETLMSPAERTFFGALDQAVGTRPVSLPRYEPPYVLTPEAHLGKGASASRRSAR